MTAWGDKWLDGGKGVPIEMCHAACGRDTTATVVCSSCGAALRADEVTSRLGPGYPPRLRAIAVATGRFGPQLESVRLGLEEGRRGSKTLTYVGNVVNDSSPKLTTQTAPLFTATPPGPSNR
jgi:hypothetical protein